MKTVKIIKFEKYTIIKIFRKHFIDNFSGGECIKINKRKYYFITKPILVNMGMKFPKPVKSYQVFKI